jgi:hypothetical protein
MENFFTAPPISQIDQRAEGAGEKVDVEEVFRVVAEDDVGSDHHAAQGVPDHPFTRGLPKRL